MRNIKKVSILFLGLLLLLSNFAFAFEVKDVVGEFKFNQEFIDWLNLSEEERANRIEPRPYDIPNTKYQVRNPIARIQTVGNSLVSRFSLRDIISENLIIKDQGESEGCWAFASIGSLETNLALQNYYNQAQTKTYDYSEKHMLYYCSRDFANGETNRFGFARKAEDPGNFQLSHTYFTTQAGPILESQMPFTNDFPKISLSEVQNKEPKAKIYDTKVFPSHNSTDSDIEDVKNDVKNYIKQYGGVEAAIYGAELLSDFYNNNTGALYCNDAQQYSYNHDILIIGWDDNYSRENFNESVRPQNNGAWIIKNSWGDKLYFTYDEMRETIFKNTDSSTLAQYGITQKEDITDEIVESFIEYMGYHVAGNNQGYMPIGDNGFMFVSYEDANIYRMMEGIQKATDTVDNDYIYQYDFGPAYYILPLLYSEAYIASDFEKQSNEKEYLTEVSLFAPETYECEVFVNTNGLNKTTNVLKRVTLKSGNTEVFDAGYHTIEFAEPVEITGNAFTVVIHVMGTRENSVYLAGVAPVSGQFYDVGDIVEERNFWTLPEDFRNDQDWYDTADLNELTGGKIPDCNFTIKAFTIKEDKLSGNPIVPDPDEPIVDPPLEDDSHPIPFVVSSAKANAKDAKAYYFTDTSTKEYMTMNVELNSLVRSDKNDTYEYFYYLSTSPNETGIENWVRITADQKSTSSIKFPVNTNDLSNYSEILKGKDVYVYVKEIVKKNGEEKTTISKGIELKFEDDITVYKDNVKQSGSGTQKETQGKEENKGANTQTQAQNTTNQTKADDTTAKRSLPNTGKTIYAILIILAISGIGVFIYKKYRNMNF